MSMLLQRNRPRSDKVLPFHKLRSMKTWPTLALLLISLSQVAFSNPVEDHPTLSIGSKAPSFSLKGVDGKTYTLASFSKYKILVIIFTCNHCPTAQAYEERIIQLAKDYKEKNVAIVAVNPNDPTAVRL